MLSGTAINKWAYAVVAFLIGLDLLVGYRAFERLILRQGEISPDAPFFLLLLIALQLLLLLLYGKLRESLRYYDRLKTNFEHELELSHQVMEALDNAVCVVDGEGRYVYVNRAGCELLGMSRQTILGHTAADFLVSPSGEEQAEMLRQSLTGSIVVPVTLRHVSGEMVQVVFRVTPRWLGGRVVGAISAEVPGGVPASQTRSSVAPLAT